MNQKGIELSRWGNLLNEIIRKRSIINKVILLCMLLLSATVRAQYAPNSKGEHIKHTYYELDYNEEHEQANWVYHILTRAGIDGITKRSGSFKSDLRVQTKSATPSDYKDSGYDRGHLCPAADMKQNDIAMRETFYMSNMSPQHPSLNRGMWNRIEAFVRDAVNDSAYVVTGPIFKESLGIIGRNKVTIPGYYYKVVYYPKQQKMLAFLIANKANEGEVEQYITTVDTVEQLTGIDFFALLPDHVENRLEKQKYRKSTMR